MCTLIGMWRMFERAPLVVAANRDERLDRPSAAPSLREAHGRRMIAPTDLSAGGTWLGLNDVETFVGITNRHLAFKPDAQRSRGLLVLDALAAGSAAEIDDAFSQLDVRPFAGFHLFVADRRHAVVLWSDGVVLHRVSLAPGLTIVTERSFDAAPTTREALIRDRLGAPASAPDDRALIELLATRADNGFDGVNVLVHEHRYGTRSSTILRLGADAGDVQLLHADGPPDRTPFLDQRRLLDALLS